MSRAEEYQRLFDLMMEGDRKFLRDVIEISPANWAVIVGPAQRIKENRELLAVCLDALADDKKEQGE